MKTIIVLIGLLVSNIALGAVTCVFNKDKLGIAVDGYVGFNAWKMVDKSVYDLCVQEVNKNICLVGTEHKKVTFYEGCEDGVKPEVQEFDQEYVQNKENNKKYTSGLFKKSKKQLMDQCDYDRMMKWANKYPQVVTIEDYETKWKAPKHVY